jgi:hypothetical protein
MAQDLKSPDRQPVPLDYRQEIKRRWWSWEGFAISVASLAICLAGLFVAISAFAMIPTYPVLGWLVGLTASMVTAVAADGIVEPLKSKRRLLRWLGR